MSHLEAIPPPPQIESDDEMFFYGFPYTDQVEFYKRIVDPSWTPPKPGVEPDTLIALMELQNRTGIKMTLVEVWTNEDPPDLVFMVAVASASKANPESSVQLTQEELDRVARVGHFEGVKPEWMRSAWTIENLKEMPYPELV